MEKMDTGALITSIVELRGTILREDTEYKAVVSARTKELSNRWTEIEDAYESLRLEGILYEHDRRRITGRYEDRLEEIRREANEMCRNKLTRDAIKGATQIIEQCEPITGVKAITLCKKLIDCAVGDPDSGYDHWAEWVTINKFCQGTYLMEDEKKICYIGIVGSAQLCDNFPLEIEYIIVKDMTDKLYPRLTRSPAPKEHLETTLSEKPEYCAARHLHPWDSAILLGKHECKTNLTASQFAAGHLLNVPTGQSIYSNEISELCTAMNRKAECKRVFAEVILENDNNEVKKCKQEQTSS